MSARLFLSLVSGWCGSRWQRNGGGWCVRRTGGWLACFLTLKLFSRDVISRQNKLCIDRFTCGLFITLELIQVEIRDGDDALVTRNHFVKGAQIGETAGDFHLNWLATIKVLLEVVLWLKASQREIAATRPILHILQDVC